MPAGIRVICKLIEILAKKKFPSITKSDLYNILLTFLFDLYILPQFKFPGYMKELNLIDKIQEENLNCFKKILRKVLNREITEHNIHLIQYNDLVKELYYQVIDHYEKVLNISSYQADLLLQSVTLREK